MLLLLAANVVLVTWDGVARVDFHDRGALPLLWSRHDGVAMDIEASDPSLVSLPSYKAIFAGMVGVDRETFAEKLRRVEGLPREKVAVFASWAGVADAVEHVPHRLFVDAGPACFLPWNDTRGDEETFSRAMQHFATFRPRFLYIALGESDDRAHEGDRAAYLAVLRRYDAWLDQLLRTVDAQTTVFVTTDHGRGAGENWRKHGAAFPESREIWLYARGPGAKSLHVATQLDLRPAIESALGVASGR